MSRITLEKTLTPKTSKELLPLETELLLRIRHLIRARCSIDDLSTPSLAQQLRTTTDVIMDLKKSLRKQRYLECEYTRDEDDQLGLVVRMVK